MTGVVSSMADHLELGAWDVAAAGASAMFAFLAGAACTASMVNFGRRHRLHSEYAGPLLLEAALLLTFGLLGSRLAQLHAYFAPITVMLLCFTMGLQNALITKLSHAAIRTTHVTGIVTDIGIELGKPLDWNRLVGHRTNCHPRLPTVAGSRCSDCCSSASSVVVWLEPGPSIGRATSPPCRWRSCWPSSTSCRHGTT